MKNFRLPSFFKLSGKSPIILFVLLFFNSFSYGGKTIPKQASLKLMWKTPAVFKTPEAVLYDQKRNCLYVGNFNVKEGFLSRNDRSFDEFISKVSTKGEIEQLKWVTGLNSPTGMSIFKEKLYVVERKCLVEIDIKAGRILNRFEIPDSLFANDVIFDNKGIGYISDNNRNAKVSIYKFANGAVKPWIDTNKVHRPNGLCLEKGRLICYDYKSKYLKGIRSSDRNIKNIVYLGFESTTGGLCDGLKVVNENKYIISDWNGMVYLADKTGHIEKLLDMDTIAHKAGSRVNSADIEYIPEMKLLIIPTFFDNRLIAYKLKIQ